MSDPEGLAIARRLIAEEAEQQTGFLDLGMLGLTELPAELNELTHLTRLNLGVGFMEGEQWREAAHSIGANQFADPACWTITLPNLLELWLIECLVSDLSALSGLSSLQRLDCWHTQVSDLSALSGLSSLQRLDCRFTQVSDLSALSSLSSLQRLYCGGTQVSDLSALSGLSSLQHLSCSGTQVSDLSALSGLSSLQQLYCSSTQVSDLSALSGLSSLQTVNASKCELAELPRALLEPDRLQKLILHETRLPGIPLEVLSQDAHSDDCRQRLLDHLTDLEAGAEPVPDAKLLVIGNGRIGKTQICRRLHGETYDEGVLSTHGISVQETPLEMSPGEQATLLNIWDFGGQDLYHGTHALFMKTRAVFAVVWIPQSATSREYEHGGMRFRNQPLPYWLNYVRDAAGDVCPVVVVQNQCDTPQDEVLTLPVDPDELQKLPYLQTVHYSAKEDRKRDSLNEALQEAVRHLRGHEGITTIGTGRMLVRRQIQQWIDEDSGRDPERKQHRTLTQEQFRQLCADRGHVTNPDSLLDYLHNTGVVFYRRGLFGDGIILDQSWALDAIYTVFHREQCYRQLEQLNGRFTRPLLESLVWQEYSVEEQQLFLSLMESCGICFIHRDGRHGKQIETEYVAPDLLPDRDGVSSQLAGRWDDSAPVVERAWPYEFLHPGLVRSIISRVGKEAGDSAVYWKYGVWFYEATTRATAIIEQRMDDDSRGRIVLQTQGDAGHQLLERISQWIVECNDRAGGRPGEVEGVPIRGDGMHASGDDSDDGDRRAPAVQITDPPRPANERVACVSYAWKEERSADPTRAGKVEQFCEALTQAELSIIRDSVTLNLGDRLSSFMRQIGNSDRIYIFLSDAYLKSPNCMYELLTIWQSSGDDPERFRDRTRVLTMPGTDVYSIPSRLKYAAHWKRQRDETRKLIDENGVDVLGPTELKHWKQIQDFAHNVSEILVHMADVLQAQDFDQFIDQAIAELEQPTD